MERPLEKYFDADLEKRKMTYEKPHALYTLHSPLQIFQRIARIPVAQVHTR